MKRVILIMFFLMILNLSIFVSAESLIDVSARGDNVEVTAQIESGTVSFDLLYGDGSQFTHRGKNSFSQLKVTTNDNINFDDDTDKYFVASYVGDGTNPMSYLMRATNFVLDGTTNKTDIQYYKSGSWSYTKTGAKETDSFSLGNLDFTVGRVNRLEKEVELSIVDGSFNRLYDTNGYYIKFFSTVIPAPEASIFLYDSSNSVVGEYEASWDSGIVKVEKVVTQCSDSDGGINEFVSGTTFYGEYSLQAPDFCEGGLFNNTGTILYERYCDDWGNRMTEEITCELGCVDGVCRKSSGNDGTTNLNICEDTEGGKDYSKGGMVGHGKGSPPSSATSDVCVDSNTLKEVYCENGYYAEEIVNCPSGCLEDSSDSDSVYGYSYNNVGCGPLTSLASCAEVWSCTSWSVCLNDQQTRTCTDSNSCGTVVNRPPLSQNCVSLLDEWIVSNDIDEYIVNVEGKEFAVERGDDGELILRIDDEEITVESIMEIIKEFSEYSNINKEDVNSLSEEDIWDIVNEIDEIDEIELKEEDGDSVYVVLGTKKAWLLFFIPISASIEQIVDAKTGEIIITKKPWWHFLAFGV